jgi:LacI family transcriptional regulator
VNTKRNRQPHPRRRILLLADFAYASAKAVAAGVVRFVSSRAELDLSIRGGHPGNADAAYALESGIDGIISCLGTNVEELRRTLDQNPHCPVVFASVARDLSSLSRRRSAAILCDHAAIAGTAADLLVRHGLAEFGYVGARIDPSAPSWNAERREAFVHALEGRGFRVRIYEPSAAEEGADAETAALATWLKGLPKPCGLFTAYDMRAMHVLGICRASGIAVPEQLQIVSADNEEWICEHTSPALTSVEPDFESCGWRAAETLLAMMDGETWEPVQMFGVKCVEQRMSTTDIHGSVNRAVRAKKYMRDHLAEPLADGRLAAILGCSPRMLQLSYRAVFGRTVQEDLSEMRFERAKRLLSDSSIPVCDIPERLGFTSPNHLMRLFKARTGMTMLQWRRGTTM